jgi:hypothetical protein
LLLFACLIATLRLSTGKTEGNDNCILEQINGGAQLSQQQGGINLIFVYIFELFIS